MSENHGFFKVEDSYSRPLSTNVIPIYVSVYKKYEK